MSAARRTEHRPQHIYAVPATPEPASVMEVLLGQISTASKSQHWVIEVLSLMGRISHRNLTLSLIGLEYCLLFIRRSSCIIILSGGRAGAQTVTDRAPVY
jgi:hypothetical protein